MNDPIAELLGRAVDLGAPPDTYWRGYSARLRARLDEKEPRFAAWLNPLLAASVAAAALAGLLLVRREEPVVTRAPEPRPPASVESVSPPPPPVVERPQVQRIERSSAPQETLPTRSLAVQLTEFARPAIEHEPLAAPKAEKPFALHLTDFRLLRNDIEIARGDDLRAEPGGLIWFADATGQRFAISATPQTGFHEAGIARGNVLTFDSGVNRFLWLSAAEIVAGELTIWIRVDRVAPVPATLPPLPDRWRWPPLLGPGNMPVPRGTRLQRHLPEPRVTGGSEKANEIRFGTARSVAELP